MSALGPPANSVIGERFGRKTVIRLRYSNANDQICKNANATDRISKSGGTGDPKSPAPIKRKAPQTALIPSLLFPTADQRKANPTSPLIAA